MKNLIYTEVLLYFSYFSYSYKWHLPLSFWLPNLILIIQIIIPNLIFNNFSYTYMNFSFRWFVYYLKFSGCQSSSQPYKLIICCLMFMVDNLQVCLGTFLGGHFKQVLFFLRESWLSFFGESGLLKCCSQTVWRFLPPFTPWV